MNILKQQGTTLVQRACANVKGFSALHKRLEKKIIVSGKSKSTLSNYMRCIAHVALKYNCLPTQLELEQIEDYLLHLKKKGPRKQTLNSLSTGFAFYFDVMGWMTELSNFLPSSVTKDFP
jgi:integrase/recombinase XerD